jgi:hypothetical protein
VLLVDQVFGVAREKSFGLQAQIWAALWEICASGAPNDFSRSLWRQKEDISTLKK